MYCSGCLRKFLLKANLMKLFQKPMLLTSPQNKRHCEMKSVAGPPNYHPYTEKASTHLLPDVPPTKTGGKADN